MSMSAAAVSFFSLFTLTPVAAFVVPKNSNNFVPGSATAKDLLHAISYNNAAVGSGTHTKLHMATADSGFELSPKPVPTVEANALEGTDIEAAEAYMRELYPSIAVDAISSK